MSSATSPLSHIDLSVDELINFSLKRKEAVLAANKAICANTGERTGRSKQDRFIVREANTESTIDWSPINKPIDEDKFNALWERISHYLASREHFISNLQLGAGSYLLLACQSNH